jgi:SAM-dependent methyltransferase
MTTTSEQANQERFWGEQAQAFDAIYGGQKTGLAGFLDRTLRKDMFERFDFTLEHAQPAEGRRFLDLGCGSGRYSVALAQAGAEQVYGVDVAKEMLEMAAEAAEAAGVRDRLTLIHGGIAAFDHEPVDVSIGIGLFDYVKDAAALLRELHAVTTSRLIASFPRSNTWRAPVRKVRLGLQGCPCYFYSRRGLEQLLEECGYEPEVFEVVGKLYCVAAKPV